MDTDRRSLARALSWRVVAWALTVGIVYLFTGNAVLALAIAVADSLLKIFAYYLHERSWLGLASMAPVREPALQSLDRRHPAGAARSVQAS